MFLTELNMKNKIIVTIALSLTCGMAAAEWSQLNRDINGATYIDKEKVVAKEGLVVLWSLYDAEIPTEIKPNEYSHSAKTQIEFNCHEHTARTMVMVSYAERMGTGKVMSVKTVPSQWELINAQTWRQALFKVACPKSKP